MVPLEKSAEYCVWIVITVLDCWEQCWIVVDILLFCCEIVAGWKVVESESQQCLDPEDSRCQQNCSCDNVRSIFHQKKSYYSDELHTHRLTTAKRIYRVSCSCVFHINWPAAADEFCEWTKVLEWRSDWRLVWWSLNYFEGALPPFSGHARTSWKWNVILMFDTLVG